MSGFLVLVAMGFTLAEGARRRSSELGGAITVQFRLVLVRGFPAAALVVVHFSSGEATSWPNGLSAAAIEDNVGTNACGHSRGNSGTVR